MENFTSNNTSMSSNHSTCIETTNCDETLQQIFWFVNGVLALIILTGNAFTCVIFLSTKQLRQQYMNTFLVSLAVSDILMAVMVVPGYTSFCTGCKPYLSTDSCWILAQTKDLVFSSSFFSLLAITYDRYLAVLCPLLYGSRMTKSKVTFMVIAIWAIPALIASARNIWWRTMPEEQANDVNKVYNVILVFLLVMLPAMIMALVNALIVRAIQTQKRKTLPLRELSSVKQEISGEDTRAETSRKRRGTIACVAVVLVFVLSWIPRSVYNFAFVFGRAELVTPLLVKLSMFFLLLQSCVNPFIYSFYRADFRQAAKRLLKHGK